MTKQAYKRIFQTAAALIMGVLGCGTFTSCIADVLDECEDPRWNLAEGEARYALVSVKLSDTSSTSTRGQNLENYDDGEIYENAINFDEDGEHVIIFFDKNYRYVTHCDLIPVDAKLDSNKKDVVETVFSVKFMNPALGNVTPRYSLVALNAEGLKDKLEMLNYATATIEDITALLDKEYPWHHTGKVREYFTMASSAYLKKDAETGIYRHAQAEPLDPSVFFPTAAEAEDAERPIVAWVERNVAKVSIQFTQCLQEEPLVYLPNDTKLVTRIYYQLDRPYSSRHSWKAAITGWGVNNIEMSNHYFKNIEKPEDAPYDTYPSTLYDNINGKNKPFFSGWNSEANHRSHWSVDPHYSLRQGNYPWQYRRALDNTKRDDDGYELVKAYSAPPAPEFFSTRFISFNEMNRNIIESPIGNNDWTINFPQYEPENTFNEYIHAGHYTHNLGSTSVVVGAKLLLSGLDAESKNYDIYVDRDNIYYVTKEDFVTSFRLRLRSILESAESGELTYPYYKFGPDVAADGAYTNGQKLALSVPQDNRAHPYKLYLGTDSLTRAVANRQANFCIPALIENGDGKVIPWMDGLRIAREREDGTLDVLPLTDNQLKSFIYEYAGAYEHFNHGSMFYSVPIVHNATQATVTDASYEPVTGDYGFVRNHWYRVRVNGVNLIGMPVDNLDQKLVPYTRPFDDSIAVEFEVLPWHEIQTDVTLDDGSFNLK